MKIVKLTFGTHCGSILLIEVGIGCWLLVIGGCVVVVLVVVLEGWVIVVSEYPNVDVDGRKSEDTVQKGRKVISTWF